MAADELALKEEMFNNPNNSNDARVDFDMADILRLFNFICAHDGAKMKWISKRDTIWENMGSLVAEKARVSFDDWLAENGVDEKTCNEKRRNLMEEFDDFCFFKKDLIGHGAFAIVYKGRYKTKNAEVAIKAIAKKNISKAKSLLTKEIRILKELSGLKHENLVTLLKCVEEPSHVFLVMEYCNGGDLGDYLNAKQKIPESAIRHFFAQIARALEAMKMKDIVHRDLKPQNILLCNPHKFTDVKAIEPTDMVVKLADFGFARFLTGDGMAGTLCGSPMYMAPEVIMSLQYCAKADLWSVGTIMYQCLVGKAPFIAQTPQALKQFYERNKELRPNIPTNCSVELADLLLRLLKRSPKDRIEFVHFFNHPFLRKAALSDGDERSSSASETASIAQKLMKQDAHYYAMNASPTHSAHPRSPIRAKFSATPLANNASSRDNFFAAGISNATGGTLRQQSGSASPRCTQTPLSGGSSGMYAQTQQQHRIESPRQNSLQSTPQQQSRFATNQMRLTSATIAERQAPLRPLNSPGTPRRAIPQSTTTNLYGNNSATNFAATRHFTAAYNLPNEVANAASDLSPRRVGSLSAKPAHSNQMIDSNDFTFLPPLNDRNSAATTANLRYPTAAASQQQQQQHHESLGARRSATHLSSYQNASTTASDLENPVKQVQVHSSAAQEAAEDRGDPVPSQRFAYAQMQERRKMTSRNLRASPLDEKPATPTYERRIPSVEELNLPETKFVVHEPPRGTARSNLFCANNDASIKSNLRAPFTAIPKSATCGEFSAAAEEGGKQKAAIFPTSVNQQQQQLVHASSLSRTISSNSGAYSHEAPSLSPLYAQEQAQFNQSSPRKKEAIEFEKKQQQRAHRNEETTKTERKEEKKHKIHATLMEEKVARRASSEHRVNDEDVDEDEEEEEEDANGMEESTMSQVMDSITGDEELATLRRAQQRSSSTSAQQHAVLRNSDEAAAAAADLLFFNNATAGATEPPPPELEAETVLDNEHRQTLAKLRFVLELIETLINVAEKKTNPMAMIMEGGTRKSSRQQFSSSSSGSSSSEVSRRAEQLVLYVRSLHVLSSALVMAQRQINADTLKPSPAVQTVLNQLNEKYHHCLARSQELASLGIPGMDPTMCVVSAERIMYQHAIDLCQSAALDELFGHPQLCPKRYQTAYMILHTLYEQVQNEQDKNVLAKYKNAVEKRMRILEQQGFVTAVDTKADDAIHINRSHFHNNAVPIMKNILKEGEHV